MITDPFFYLCAVPAVLLFGMAKGGLGGGLALLSVPLMALAVSPVTAAAVLLPILIIMDATAIWRFRGQWSKINLRYTLPGAIAGVVVGALTFRYLSDDAIRIMIGAIAVAFCLNYWLRSKNGQQKTPSSLRGNFWGGIAGFTSFGIHAGDPPISMYILPLKLEKTMMMATFAAFFAVVNLAKAIPYAWLGLLDHSSLMTSLVLVPIAPLGVLFGYYCMQRIEEATIYRLCYGFLLLVGLKLLWEGLGLSFDSAAALF